MQALIVDYFEDMNTKDLNELYYRVWYMETVLKSTDQIKFKSVIRYFMNVLDEDTGSNWGIFNDS